MAVVDRGVQRGHAWLRAELSRLVERAQHWDAVEGKSEVGANPGDGESERGSGDDHAEPVARLTNRPHGSRETSCGDDSERHSDEDSERGDRIDRSRDEVG